MTTHKFYSPQATMSGGGESKGDQAFGEWQLCPKCPGSGQLWGMSQSQYTTIGWSTCDVCQGAKIIARPIYSDQTDSLPPEPAKESQPEEEKYTRSELFEICGGWSEHLMAVTEARVSVLDLSDIFNDWFDKNYSSSPVSGPEPSEQSQPDAFLEWLDGEIEKQKSVYDNPRNDLDVRKLAYAGGFRWLPIVREKYLSLHAQPKGEVEGRDEFVPSIEQMFTRKQLQEAHDNYLTYMGTVALPISYGQWLDKNYPL